MSDRGPLYICPKCGCTVRLWLDDPHYYPDPPNSYNRLDCVGCDAEMVIDTEVKKDETA